VSVKRLHLTVVIVNAYNRNACRNRVTLALTSPPALPQAGRARRAHQRASLAVPWSGGGEAGAVERPVPADSDQIRANARI
jgi:hypothetical protein